MLALIECCLDQWSKQQRAIVWGYHTKVDLGKARHVEMRLVPHQSVARKKGEGGGVRGAPVLARRSRDTTRRDTWQRSVGRVFAVVRTRSGRV